MSTFEINKIYVTEVHSNTFWPSQLKADHFHNINFLNSIKFGKHKTTNKALFNHFPAI